MVRGLKSIMFLLLLSVSFNLFLTPGTPIFKIGFLQMSWKDSGLRLYGDSVLFISLWDHEPDTHDDAEPADRRSGKEPWIFKEGRCSGP